MPTTTTGGTRTREGWSAAARCSFAKVYDAHGERPSTSGFGIAGLAPGESARANSGARSSIIAATLFADEPEVDRRFATRRSLATAQDVAA